MSHERTIHVLWTQKVIDAAVTAGADRTALVALAGDAVDSRISLTAHFAVWDAAMRELDDPGFPIRVATLMQIDDYETLGLACKTAPDLRAAIGRVARYLSIWTDAYECRMRDDGAPNFVIQGAGSGIGQQGSAESAVAEALHVMREICQSDIRPQRAHFRHEQPRSVSAHASFFECELRFESTHDGLELSSAALDTPLALADDGLSRYLESRLEELSAATAPLALIDRVRRIVSDELPNGVPKINDVAKRVGVSGRSLQRQLAAQGGYVSLVEHTRRALAKTMLASSKHTLGEIAFLVGFSEPSAFHRAFKRWTGATPATFRARTLRPEPI